MSRWRPTDMSTLSTMFASMTAIVLGASVLAGSGKGGGGTGGDPGTGTALTLRIKDEMAPPGGMVQMKVFTTEVTPISGGRPSFSLDPGLFADTAGFGMFTTGDLAGAAVVNGLHVAVSYATNGALTADYPLLAIALRIRPDVKAGAT